MISGIVEPVISLVDAAFVGRLGDAELGGVGLASSFFLLLVWMLAQTKSALTAQVAKYYGADNLKEIIPLVPIAICLNVLIGLVLLGSSWLFLDDIFSLYGATDDVRTNAETYYCIRSIGFPIVFANLMIFGAFRGFQNTAWPMWTSLIGGIVNLILDPILIFGLGNSIPALGVEGAAWASVFAQVSMLIAAVFILITRTPFGLIPSTLRHPETRGLLTLSGDLFIRTLAMNVAYFLGNRHATLLGDAEIAAHTIAMNIWLFSAYFIDGYAEAGMVLSGKFKGSGNVSGLKTVTFKVLRYSVGVGLLIAVVYGLGYFQIGPLFTTEASVLAVFSTVFWIAIVSQPINGIAFAMDGVFNGLGDGALMRNVLVLSTVLIFIPCLFLFKYLEWGLSGVWVAFLLWMVARGLPLLIAFRGRYDS